MLYRDVRDDLGQIRLSENDVAADQTVTCYVCMNVARWALYEACHDPFNTFVFHRHGVVANGQKDMGDDYRSTLYFIKGERQYW